MKTKQKMLTKPITAGLRAFFYFKSVKDGIISSQLKFYNLLQEFDTHFTSNGDAFFLILTNITFSQYLGILPS